MQKKSSVQNEKMQLWLQSEGEKYLELLKRGQVECRDFSSETLKQLLSLKEGIGVISAAGASEACGWGTLEKKSSSRTPSSRYPPHRASDANRG